MNNEYRSFEAMELERRSFDSQVEVRAEGGEHIIAGYAAVFESRSVMLYGFKEEFLRGAFEETLRVDDQVALWQHDKAQVLGRRGAGTLRLWEDDYGLRFEVAVPDTQTGRDALISVGRGDVRNMSFGFMVRASADEDWRETEDGTPLRRVRKAGLIEVSPVTFPAYQDTSVSVLRSAPEWVQRALTQGVDDRSAEMARARLALRQREIDLLRMETSK